MSLFQSTTVATDPDLSGMGSACGYKGPTDTNTCLSSGRVDAVFYTKPGVTGDACRGESYPGTQWRCGRAMHCARPLYLRA
jgi:hypothetical protein